MKNSNTIKNLLTRIMSMGVSFIATLIITNVVIKYLSNEVYGMYQLSNDFVNYAMVISIALNSMASRYITLSYYENNNQMVNCYFNTILFANVFLAMSLVFPLILVINYLDNIISIPIEYVIDIKILFALMFLNFLVSICTSIFGVPTFVKNRIDLDSYRTIESNILKIILLLFMYKVFNPKIWYLGICIILSNVYVVFRNIKYTKKLTPEIRPLDYHSFRIKYLRELLSSGIWNSFTKISSILLSGLDLIIANNLVSTSAMGLLSVAKTIPKYIISSMSTVASVFTPAIMIDYASKDKKKIIDTISISIKINSLFSLIIEIIMLTLGYRIFKLWLPNQDTVIIQTISVISMIGYIIVMPFEVLWSVFTATNKVKLSSIYLTIESIITLAIVFISLNFCNNEITKLFVIAGTSSIFETIRGLTFLPLASAYCLSIPKKTFYIPLIRFLSAFILSLVISISLNIFKLPLSVFSLVLLIIIEIFICVLCGYFIIFTKRERKIIFQIVTNKIKSIDQGGKTK